MVARIDPTEKPTRVFYRVPETVAHKGEKIQDDRETLETKQTNKQKKE